MQIEQVIGGKCCIYIIDHLVQHWETIDILKPQVQSMYVASSSHSFYEYIYYIQGRPGRNSSFWLTGWKWYSYYSFPPSKLSVLLK